MARGERGESLVEVMVSVMLMGIVVAAILGGLFALVTVSDDNNEKTKVATALQTYVERFKQPLEEMEYIPCGGANDDGFTNYQDALDATNVANVLDFDDPDYEGFEVDFEVQHWNFTHAFQPACWDKDRGLQRITITVRNGRSDRKESVETLTIFKRDQTCPAVEDYDNQDAGPC